MLDQLTCRCLGSIPTTPLLRRVTHPKVFIFIGKANKSDTVPLLSPSHFWWDSRLLRRHAAVQTRFARLLLATAGVVGLFRARRLAPPTLFLDFLVGGAGSGKPPLAAFLFQRHRRKSPEKVSEAQGVGL